MNVGIIISLKWRVVGESDYSALTFSGFSAQYTMETVQSKAGIAYSVKISAKIAKIDPATSLILATMINRKLDIQFTDGNNMVHTLGSDEYPARMAYRSAIGGNAGDWNGYDVSITWEGTAPHAVEET